MIIKVKTLSTSSARAAIGVGCMLAAVACSSPAFGASSSERSGTGSASQILRSAISSATKFGSVRVTVHFFSGTTAGELVQDSSQNSAVQTVAIGSERVSILLSDGIVYFSGNNPGLVHYFGLSDANAAILAGRWVSATSSDASYQSLIAGLSLTSALKEITPTGSIARGKSVIVRGQRTTSVSGTGPAGLAHVTLFIAAKGRPLPVEAVGSGGGKGTKLSGEIVTFSRWGEHVKIPTPSSAIPISSLASGSPTGE